ncbi:MAG: repeat-containing protein YrrB [Pseudomonadota bacterium]|jgi:ketosteroid isomerase-like protein
MKPSLKERLCDWIQFSGLKNINLAMLLDEKLLSLAAPKHSYPWVTLAWQLGLGLTSALTIQAATPPQDSIKQAIQSGQLDQALKLVQQEKQNAPKDVQLRFLEGVIHAQQGQTDKAIDIFKKLTESNPDLSEAYNNLGVLYAAKGKLEESRAHLEKALQTHPSYAAAHRNLSDVQSQLAKQTYAKALQVDGKVKNNAPQLTLLGSIDPNKKTSASAPSNAASTATQTEASKPAAVVAAAPTAPAPPVAPPAMPATAAHKPVVPSAPAVTASAPTPQATAPVAAVAVTTAPKAAPTKEDAQQKQVKADQADIRNAIAAWAKAWSQKDMNRYLAAYGSSFSPPDKMTRTKWEGDRRVRILSKKTIRVDVNNLKIDLAGNKATAHFQQIYESDNFKGNSHKTLEMVKQGDRWLIARETVN